MSAIAKIEVSVVPTEGGTLIEDETHPAPTGGRSATTREEAIIVTADDVAWVLANPVLAMSGSRGYGRMWIIRNIEGVGLDMRVEVDVKPVMLLDVDGVINAITKKPATFAWPRASWRTGKAVCDDFSWPINWAVDVVDFLIGVHEQDRAEIRWHTTWQHDAQNLANLVGLPTFPIAEAPEAPVSGIPNGVLEVARMRDGLPRWWKYGAARRVVIEERRPLVWVDDDITSELTRRTCDNLANIGPVHYISPDPTTGLIPRNLSEIDAFLSLARDGAESTHPIRRSASEEDQNQNRRHGHHGDRHGRCHRRRLRGGRDLQSGHVPAVRLPLNRRPRTATPKTSSTARTTADSSARSRSRPLRRVGTQDGSDTPMTVHWHDDEVEWCPCDEPSPRRDPRSGTTPTTTPTHSRRAAFRRVK